ncbi:hypothetical protein ABFS82_11G059000 [Erythranthe guttata]|uniref:Uncharacterized protein n=1 Tax=Erythranthe guttata TaxID=4155 RepID=A0A022QSU1_ERYGU|nr:PREDICTED: uncharacterized protein LOC105965514 [Erythranthe guttata]XP_012845521.1 PREDICTED: uncharacterized protein LOC105965514 [Erythranthe guttata]XP_012845522.1 PREDICTED: uncharacterized protein LOC105965514 [Erythranthe guttata]XP_012845523.1 PREDICTED: uncharacterized protein LOC105965514 [Erythranthe guttata]EYU30649.1 hypothetical protein MIMGU_mgv1a013052mg [Erythranthe guttata]|eukprot:XP_012845520.1 PREDICTED: uncharacterized protein LOC105965514 [Erythranthe guttata]
MELADLTVIQNDRVRVKRKTLEAVLQQCQQALEQLASGCNDDEDDDDENVDGQLDVPEDSAGPSSVPASCDTDTSEFYDLLKSRVEGPDFLKKLEDAQASLPENIAEEGSSWDMISENDLWEGGNVEADPDDYVLVGEEDIMDGIASFMAAYLLSLKQTKDLTPNQLQAALSKTFSMKKKKGKLQKAWDGSKVIYNVASWGATAIGIYQNPALFRAASTAFWTSCHVISKLF